MELKSKKMYAVEAFMLGKYVQVEAFIKKSEASNFAKRFNDSRIVTKRLLTFK